MEATLTEQKARIEELDRELEQRAGRQRQAEKVAAAETQRVVDLKGEMARLRLLAEGRHTERNPVRAPAAATAGPAQEGRHSPGERASSSPFAAPSTGLALQELSNAVPEMSTGAPATPAMPPDLPASPTGTTDVLASATGTTDVLASATGSADPPASSTRPADTPASPMSPDEFPASPTLPAVLASPPDAFDVPSAADPAARILLEDEEDDDRAEMERRFNDSEAQLERTRAALRRLERILVERDRAMDIKNARIDALQAELHDKLVIAPHEDEAPPPKRGTQRSRAPAAGAASPAPLPTMICLTGEAPSSYPLHKRVVTIGRNAECDIQVATHFVSREHARLSVSPEAVFIEDLGSKNGVFVNAVRVQRDQLRDGDLVTVGETQFRFVTD